MPVNLSSNCNKDLCFIDKLIVNFALRYTISVSMDRTFFFFFFRQLDSAKDRLESASERENECPFPQPNPLALGSINPPGFYTYARSTSLKVE